MATKIFAIVREKEKPIFVASLSDAQMDDFGDFGIELLVTEYCDAHKLTFMDYAL